MSSRSCFVLFLSHGPIGVIKSPYFDLEYGSFVGEYERCSPESQLLKGVVLWI